MLKIQFAVTHSAPGGLLELWNDISEGLAARGHMVQRFGIYPELNEPAPGPAWLHIGATRPRTPLAGIRTFFKLMSFLRRERPDAIVTGMPAANVIIPLAAFLSGVSTKVIATHHSPIETHNPKLNSLDNLTGLLPNVHAIMSVSNTVAGSLSSKSRRYLRKSHTIRNALPGHIERLLATLASAPPRIASKDRRVVALGRLAYQKNYPMLISAIARLPNTHLAIAGGGEDEASLRQQAMDEGSADRIDFLGYLSREEALREAAKADIFVQVSHFEGAQPCAHRSRAPRPTPDSIGCSCPSRRRYCKGRHMLRADSALGRCTRALQYYRSPLIRSYFISFLGGARAQTWQRFLKFPDDR